MDNNFKDFEYFFAHLAAKTVIDKHAQAFKQILIDEYHPEKANLADPDHLEFVFREFFVASMMANLEILSEYHRWLLATFEQHPEQSEMD